MVILFKIIGSHYYRYLWALLVLSFAFLIHNILFQALGCCVAAIAGTTPFNIVTYIYGMAVCLTVLILIFAVVILFNIVAMPYNYIQRKCFTLNFTNYNS